MWLENVSFEHSHANLFYNIHISYAVFDIIWFCFASSFGSLLAAEHFQ